MIRGPNDRQVLIQCPFITGAKFPANTGKKRIFAECDILAEFKDVKSFCNKTRIFCGNDETLLGNFTSWQAHILTVGVPNAS